MALPDYKTNFLRVSIDAKILTFGSFTLKSGRQSPYFFNCGLFHQASAQRSLSNGFAATLDAANLDFDVVFGPAYKGIPLAAVTIDKLVDIDEKRYGGVSWSFNRKEKKDHGEGGSIVGASLKGKRIVIVDDVITAGTAIREAIDIITAEGGTLVGIVVAFNRQEKLDDTSDESALGRLHRQLGIPVTAILKLDDVVDYLKASGTEDEIKQLAEYSSKYRSSD
jgi:orotate phosphoribosyltransferase